ncbi:olfactory receptor 6N2-like [Pygocentrus nattereri]|uniref:G-protein coupled receptors family 1 profile domain-containing protein n=1 Tax=Pygocentrus nattereri TaxID=42514 RepID=A0AAR2JGU4_PYGNA|nr:olfactory receptor 6N2-like [Pygocentrus nattereri]
MDNSSDVIYLVMNGHVELQKYRYFYFVITLTVYLLIICFNAVVIFVICTNKCLHEPMYIFIAALLFNSLLGTTALYPKLLSDFLSDRPVTSYSACLFQAFCIYTYAASEFTLLSAMAYDRYVSICKPLQYATLVKISTVKKLLLCCWFFSACEIGILIILTSRLQLCKFKMTRIYCNDYSIAKLSCGDTSVTNIYGLFGLTLTVFPPMFFIFYSYARIFEVCLKNSKEFRRKALQTCFPHLFIFISFSVFSCLEVINTRLEGNIPHLFSVIISIENLVIPPLINPVMYGLKLHEIYRKIKKILWKRKTRRSF